MSNESRNALVVEDNAENRYLATLLLEGEGFTVRCACNGAEALAAVETENFSVILLDLALPDIDGFEVARRIRAGRPGGRPPIIAVSAFAMATDRKRAFAAGCNGYLEKPIDADAFVAQVMCQAGIVPV